MSLGRNDDWFLFSSFKIQAILIFLVTKNPIKNSNKAIKEKNNIF